MTAFETPDAAAPGEEWGALAVSIPGWRWIPGMAVGGEVSPRHRRVGDHWHMRSAMLDPRRKEAWPDPDDAATAGCLEALLGGPVLTHLAVMADPVASNLWHHGRAGRARIAAAAANGRWPGGAS